MIYKIKVKYRPDEDYTVEHFEHSNESSLENELKDLQVFDYEILSKYKNWDDYFSNTVSQE